MNEETIIKFCNDCWACRMVADGKKLEPGDLDQLKQEYLIYGPKVHANSTVREVAFKLKTGEGPFPVEKE